MNLFDRAMMVLLILPVVAVTPASATGTLQCWTHADDTRVKFNLHANINHGFLFEPVSQSINANLILRKSPENDTRTFHFSSFKQYWNWKNQLNIGLYQENYPEKGNAHYRVIPIIWEWSS